MKKNKHLVILGCFSILLVLLTNYRTDIDIADSEIEQGYLKTTNIDFKDGAIVNLDGNWHFVFNELNLPTELSTNTNDYIEAPKKWDGVTRNGNVYPSFGYATYHLKIEMDSEYTELALKVSEALTAYNVYWNGELLGGSGKVGTSTDTHVGNLSSKIYVLDDIQKSNDLVIHISNYDQNVAGLFGEVLFGDSSVIKNLRTENLLLETFYFGALIVMAFYHFILYVVRKDDFISLSLSIFMLIMSVRITIMGERTINYILPFLTFVPKMKLEFLTFYVAALMFVNFIHQLYYKHFNEKIWSFIKLSTLACVVAVIILPTNIGSHTLQFYQTMVILVSIYIFYIILRAMREEIDGAGVILFGSTVLFIATANDILFARRVIDSHQYTSLGLLIFIFCLAIVISIQNANAHAKSIELAYKNKLINMELFKLNEELETKVSQRTEELQVKNEQLEILSRTDGLTGLYNHTAIFQVANNSFDIHGENQLSIAMIDIDHFKQVNDTYGHQIGDQALSEVAKKIKSHLRPSDSVGRYGGEEFLVILGGVDYELAYKIIERVRKSIADTKFTDKQISITISAGVVSKQKGKPLNSLINEADELLYKSKNNGRNKVSIQRSV